MNQDPRAALERAQNLTQGKGFFGWITRLFMGKSALEQMNAGVTQAQGYLDQAEAQARVRETGAPAQAKVLAIADTGALVNFNPVVDLSLELHPEGGQPFPIQVRTPVSKIAVPRVGDTLSVKYNPQNPTELAIL